MNDVQYVGITARDPIERKREWERKGYNVSNFKVKRRRLLYEEAQDLEDYYKRLYRCKAAPGGPRESGRVYSVYTF